MKNIGLLKIITSSVGLALFLINIKGAYDPRSALRSVYGIRHEVFLFKQNIIIYILYLTIWMYCVYLFIYI